MRSVSAALLPAVQPGALQPAVPAAVPSALQPAVPAGAVQASLPATLQPLRAMHC